MKTLFGYTDSSAVFSSCRTWRYTLTRTINPHFPMIAFIGLNPSTADETLDDPTIRRCINFSRSWGFGQYVMLNLFGFRSTLPSGLLTINDPVGPDNDRYIADTLKLADAVCVAWGSHAKVRKILQPRAAAVLEMIKNPMCLGINADGMPVHPLYQPANLKLINYEQQKA